MTDPIDRAAIESQAWLDEQIRLVPRLAANDVMDCDDCGKPIGVNRKKAVPSATRCIQCQNEVEKKGR